jgi:hypothetical protein
MNAGLKTVAGVATMGLGGTLTGLGMRTMVNGADDPRALVRAAKLLGGAAMSVTGWGVAVPGGVLMDVEAGTGAGRKLAAGVVSALAGAKLGMGSSIKQLT